MDAQKVDLFIMTNSKFFENRNIPEIRQRLLAADDSIWISLQSMQFKDPTIALIISIAGPGALGIDRFFIGDVGLGIGKLLTCGGLGIWTIIDWFLIMPDTRSRNLQQLVNIFATQALSQT
jgi:TM2 domain-containing membrane protein YozV